MLLEELDDRAFKALGHRDRRALLRAIGSDERPVGELAAATELDQPVASQHLKVLRTAGLVAVRVDGNRRLYSIDFARFGEIRRFLDEFWTAKLGALKTIAERAPSAQHPDHQQDQRGDQPATNRPDRSTAP